MALDGPALQQAIYGARTPPAFGLAPEAWAARAREVLGAGPFHWVAGGAGGEATLRANRAAFARWRLRPRLPLDVAACDPAVSVLGTPSPGPVLLAPIGVLSVVHPHAELAVARAAAALRVPLVLSCVSSVPLEDVAAQMGAAPRWFQLYPTKDPALTASLLRRAEAAGYAAVVLTLDTPLLGWRESNLQDAYLPFLDGHGLANYLSDPVLRAALPRPPEADRPAAVERVLGLFTAPGFTWDGVRFVRERTRLPLLVKGITHPLDAEAALAHGADGLVVSNHGGRQVDGAVAALDALPAVAAVAGGRVPVLMDSGVRRGADVLKALALGAAAVLLGRPYVYGLAGAGVAGVRQVVQNLLADTELTLALCGRRAIAEVDRALVTPTAGESPGPPDHRRQLPPPADEGRRLAGEVVG